MSLRKDIQARLAGLKVRQLASGFDREAAVLVPVFEREGMPYFLLTLRTEEVETHKGQISFPGGMREGGESFEQTALRETQEEVGIDAGRIRLLGRLHDYLSVTRYRVVPIAGFIEEPFSTQPHPREVAEVLQVPFELFLDRSRLRVERWTRLGQEMDVHFYTYGDREIWGLTARIIRDFLVAISLMKADSG